MSTIALKAALVVGTGTGASFSDWNLAGATALFRETAPAGIAAELKFRRRDPKPTKDFVGQLGGGVKLTRQYMDTLGVPRPGIIEVTSALPAFLTDAQKNAFVLEAILAFQEQVCRDNLALGKVPQS